MSQNKLNLRNPIHLLGVGFGLGLAPRAPGTFGTLAGIPIYLAMMQLSLTQFIVLTTIFFVLGCYICQVTGDVLGEPDHGSIVWDEVVGFLITMIAIPFSWLNILLGFILFRLFDITKPFPIRYFDRHFKNGFGVMLDDLLAGVMANMVLQLLYSHLIFN